MEVKLSGKRKKNDVVQGGSAEIKGCVALSTRAVVSCGGNSSSDESDYIFDVSLNKQGNQLAASLSTQVIKLYEPSLEVSLGDFKGHKKTISSVGFLKLEEPNSLFSCSADGSVRVWDTRGEGTQSSIFEAGKGSELWSMDLGGSSGNLLVAGGNEKIFVWDIRKPTKMETLEDAHTEAVTQVKFHPEDPSQLFSASVDGLICSFDTKMDLKDDDVLQSVLNVDTSISRFGFFGSDNSKLWCTTHIHTLSLWDVKESEKVAEQESLRKAATKKWPHGEVLYALECLYDKEADRLSVLCGTADGDVGVFPVSQSKKQRGKVLIGEPRFALTSGHSSVVRCVFPWGDLGGHGWKEGGVLCWSGGEDGKIISWGEDDKGKSGKVEEAQVDKLGKKKLKKKIVEGT